MIDWIVYSVVGLASMGTAVRKGKTKGWSENASSGLGLAVGATFLGAGLWFYYSSTGDDAKVATTRSIPAASQQVGLIQASRLAQNSQSQIKPETFVKFPEPSVACLTKYALRDVMLHLLKGEKAKANSYFITKDNPDGKCIKLDSEKTYKVLSTEYNDPNRPNFGFLEIIGDNSTSSNGAWALSITAKPAN